MAHRDPDPSPLRIVVANFVESGGNPDLPVLYRALRRAGPAVVEPYSTSAVLRHDCDIIHVSWPEWIVKRDCRLAFTLADCARVLAELGLAKARGAKIAWTANNLRPHEIDRFGVISTFLTFFTRLVDQVICLSQTQLDEILCEYPWLGDTRHDVIPTGTYRGIYPDDMMTTAEARQILGLPQRPRIALAFGMVRPYKNIPTLLRCYRELASRRDDTFLLIAGKPSSDVLAREVVRECGRVSSARADLRFVPDVEIQHYLRASNCLVLATSFAISTASAILALSFDRPVLLPRRGVAVELADAAGPAWVHTYQGGMRASVLDRAFDIPQPDGRSDLGDQYSWDVAGARLYEAFTDLVGRGPKVTGQEP